MRLPTFTDLYYTSPAQLNNLDLKPEHAITYRFAADYARSGWNASLFTYYRQGRDIIDWVWREELGKWHSEQESKLDTYGLEVSGGYTTTGFCTGFRFHTAISIRAKSIGSSLPVRWII